MKKLDRDSFHTILNKTWEILKSSAQNNQTEKKGFRSNVNRLENNFLSRFENIVVKGKTAHIHNDFHIFAADADLFNFVKG